MRERERRARVVAPVRRGAGVETFESRRLLAAGALDPSFGGDGVTNSGFTGDDGAEAVVVQPDGKVVVAGYADGVGGAPDFAVARFNADGTPDTTFGVSGVRKTDMGFDDLASAVLLQGNRILVGGTSGEFFGFNDKDFALARYTSTGQLDTTFGVGGKVKTEFDPTMHAQLYSMALQPDGKIVAVGELIQIGDTSSDSVAVARYLPNGQIDTSFGFGGTITYQLGNVPKRSYGRDVTILPDGRILVLADAEAGSGTLEHPTIGLLWLMPDGLPDDTVGDGTGARIYDVGAFFQNQRIERSPADGSLYVAGMRLDFDSGGNGSARVYQFTAVGDPVGTYGDGGSVIIGSDMNLYTDVSTALQPDGKLVVAANTPGQREVWGTWTIARLTSGGAFDTSFGTGGKSTLAPGTPDYASVSDVALAPDGKIVAAGGSLYPVGTAYEYDTVVARLLGAPQPPVYRVAEVTVWGSAWGQYFKGRVGASSAGGYTVPVGAAATPLPWENIDRVAVRFTGDVLVDAGALKLTGRRAPQYATNGFQYDSNLRTATWSLAAPLPADRVHLTVSEEVAIGGFASDFAVLPGDANGSGRVDAADLKRVRSFWGTSATQRGTPAGRHDVFSDIDGSGRINVLDEVAVRRHYLDTLPAAAAAASEAGARQSGAIFRRKPYAPASATILQGDA